MLLLLGSGLWCPMIVGVLNVIGDIVGDGGLHFCIVLG